MQRVFPSQDKVYELVTSHDSDSSTSATTASKASSRVEYEPRSWINGNNLQLVMGPRLFLISLYISGVSRRGAARGQLR